MEVLEEEKKKQYKKYRITISIILMAILIGGIVGLTIWLYPYFSRILTDQEYKEMVAEKVRSFGNIGAVFALIGAQIIQTVLAIIPVGPIVMVSGILFNPWIGVLISLVGQTIGSIVVYLLVKLIGVRFVALFFDPDRIKKTKILESGTRTGVIMTGYFMIPALPKDLVSFAAPFTNIKFRWFVLISFFARIPLTIVSVMMGEALITGDYLLAIIIAVISSILAFLCFVFNSKITSFLEKLSKKEKIVENDMKDNENKVE